MEKNTSEKKNLLSTAFRLFLTFFRIGAFTFGGGYAMIPLIQKETVEKKGWLSDEEILEIIAIAESTPGPIAINAATFVGYKTAGIPGSFMATFGVVLPSFIIISILSYVLQAFQDLKAVQYAFYGIRSGVLALLVKALWTMYKKCPHDVVSYLIMGAAFLLVAIFNVSVFPVIIGCAVFGLLASLIFRRKVR